MQQQLLDKIKAVMGIENLNEMQRRMAKSSDKRITLLAPTGSGKTLAFAIPVIEGLDPARKDCIQALVIAPSRELVQQIYSVVRPLATPAKTLAIYGGHPYADEVKSLTPPPQIVIATPGRLVDHLQRSTIDISGVSILVLDEYDKSLQLGFHDQMERIVKKIRRPRRVILTSATPLAEQPDFIDFEGMQLIDFSRPSTNEDVLPPAVRHQLVESPTPDKLDTLDALLRTLPTDSDGNAMKTIVFVNHRESAERVHAHLAKLRMPVGLYHGGLDQRDREIAIQLLNNATTPVLVSTDLGSRGLDISAVANVIHYHIPPTPEAWTHRNGRTGRQGGDGSVYVIKSEKEHLPEYVETEGTYQPHDHAEHNVRSGEASIYFPAGRKEKISARDILGYICNNGADVVTPDRIGKIFIADHYALAAVPRDVAQPLSLMLKGNKIKGKSIKTTLIF